MFERILTISARRDAKKAFCQAINHTLRLTASTKLSYGFQLWTVAGFIPGVFMSAFALRVIAPAALCAVVLLTAARAGAGFTVTYEAPGVENTTAGFDYLGVETFNEQSTGTNKSFSTNFGTGSDPVDISGTYTGVQVNKADQYGGAGGTGNYAVTFSGVGYTLNLSAVNTSTQQAQPINYFGFWLSALDAGNELFFYNGNTLVYSFSPAQVLALVGNNAAYLGNPNPGFTGDNAAQPYVFLNFFDNSGSFNKVVFTENPGDGGYESDNQTVGFYVTESGTNVAPVPEPGSIKIFGAALLALAFGMAGRRRSKA
jgi:hypothetical protein